MQNNTCANPINKENDTLDKNKFEPYVVSKSKNHVHFRLREEVLPITAEQLYHILQKHL